MITFKKSTQTRRERKKDRKRNKTKERTEQGRAELVKVHAHVQGERKEGERETRKRQEAGKNRKYEQRKNEKKKQRAIRQIQRPRKPIPQKATTIKIAERIADERADFGASPPIDSLEPVCRFLGVVGCVTVYEQTCQRHVFCGRTAGDFAGGEEANSSGKKYTLKDVQG